MSNIYIQEPPTEGKVLLKTTVGDIDIELWAKEAPKACRNFIQLCLEGYYNGTIFHRIVKGFIAQGGDPSGTGTGGESIYGQPFKDEFHSRLRFNRRGLVAMANAGKDDNGSQFFFTFAATPELQNKHTIFGKVTGETVYNMMKLEDALVDHDDHPEFPQKIKSAEVLYNPFPDIIPRTLPKKKEKKEKRVKEKSTGVKNFKLLSFGEEAEEDEEEAVNANEQLGHRGKSTHDVLNDPQLSSAPAVEMSSTSLHSDDEALSGDQSSCEDEDNDKEEKILERVKKQLKKHSQVGERVGEVSEEEEEEFSLERERKEERKRKAESIRKEINDLKKSYQESKRHKSAEASSTEKDSVRKTQQAEENPLAMALKEEEKKYKEKYNFPKKGSSREAFTLGLLDKFRKKLQSVKEHSDPDDEPPAVASNNDEEDFSNDDWMAHRLHFESQTPALAKDANTKDSDWYEIHDPRSKINQQRREISKNLMKSKERR